MFFIERYQETTIEDAAEKIAMDKYDNHNLHPDDHFISGAKWQQERMYSEEEVITLLQKYRYDLSSGKTPNLGDTTGFWFEEFKKK